MYTVHVMSLTTQDQHELQLNPNAVPSPRFRFTHRFNLPLGHIVMCVLRVSLFVLVTCVGRYH